MRLRVLNVRRVKPLLVVLAATTVVAAGPAAAYADTATPAPKPGGAAPAPQPGAGTPPAGAPAPAPVTGGIPLVNTVEQTGPGISLQHVKALEQKGWYDARFLTVDLADHAVGTDLLTSGPAASGGPPARGPPPRTRTMLYDLTII